MTHVKEGDSAIVTWVPRSGFPGRGYIDGISPLGATYREDLIQDPVEAAKVWEATNQRQARDLPGLRKLMERASPFVTG